MLQAMLKSVVSNYTIMITTQLKQTWDAILYQSFFQSRGMGLPEYVDKLTVTRHGDNRDDECAVCLCRIAQGDEVRELRCDHLFHKVCLDRWLGNGYVTCPLCRDNLKWGGRDCTAELHREVIVVNFSAVGSTNDDRCQWWLR